MQPYFFPYIGYFQLINAVDKFIFYDDVNFIKSGWINRNRILMNGKDTYFTVKLSNASPNKLINEIAINRGNEKLIKTITQAYSKAPYFCEVISLIRDILETIVELKKISEISILSIRKVSEYLGLKTIFETSSQKYSHTKNSGRAERILSICRENNADTYINSYGGQELYDTLFFQEQGIKLYFIKNRISTYKQFKHDFVAGLSVIDVMMFNSKDQIKNNLNEYELI